MKRILVDKNISNCSKELLSNIGFDILETRDIPSIKGSTASHPDMQLFVYSEKKALVCAELYDYYSQQLNDFEFIPVYGIGNKYPNDCLLNIARVGEFDIHTSFQKKILSQYIALLNSIETKQGYSKCSTCILNDSSIISADKGILKNARKFGIRAYYLPDNEIVLEGYKNGFWGGCCGLISDNKLFFNGNIKDLSCFNELTEILEKEKIEPIYSTKTKLTDNGSIIMLDI